jgi:hypothetical protein
MSSLACVLKRDSLLKALPKIIREKQQSTFVEVGGGGGGGKKNPLCKKTKFNGAFEKPN